MVYAEIVHQVYKCDYEYCKYDKYYMSGIWSGKPWFVFRVAADLFSRDGVVQTEPNVLRDTVC